MPRARRPLDEISNEKVGIVDFPNERRFAWVLELLQVWRRESKRAGPNDFIFGTRTGKLENPSNILRRYVWPACDRLKIPRASWLTFWRTFATWHHEKGTAPRVLADLMGHAKVDMQFTYAQAMD